jgi:RNA polymerase sigma-70 factor (ECF subfamily)
VEAMALDSDLDLMLRVRQGDASSFDELLRRYRAPLVKYFCRLVNDQALAEDLAQEVFLRVYNARHRYRPDARFTTWLYRIATNLALNAIRDANGRQQQNINHSGEDGETSFEFVDTRASVEQEMIETDRGRMIREAIESLPENQRAAVILHKYQDVDYRQIAKVLKVSESAVKSLLFRAYETLRVRLEPLVREGLL